ncbi:hypothetical protein Mal15_61370 [Stieleria maiorica]|uniref:DUF1844 domain-containing protein n=1 Tax=Stieleria maiorica TaxID=2795974 RepID=A0A5B9MM24_9BACT|nr:DUF1844 domain-containing protein [Stieleria maiorica]QEG02054.1 hypothetical protein Mal15_61370 [Stieleria maiorica]
MSENKEEPELVVDTDWKSQVEKEKETAAEDTPSAADQPSGGAATAGDPTGDLPPASLAMLISTFYSQAMMALGVMENPSTGEKSTDLRVAKHFIDTLEMLQEKTKGNTDKDEDKMFDEVLHLLRMAFVGAQKA